MNNQLIKYGLNETDNSSFRYNANNNVIKARVVDIIMDNTHPEFKNFGEWDSLGVVFFSEVNKNINNDIIDLKSLPSAKPFYPNKKYYPLKNEVVYIISFPYFDSQNINVSSEFYYIDVVNIWNHPHHNALPDNDKIINLDNNISNTTPGIIKKSPTTETEINLGNTFKENPNIKTILPYEGDYILEGRFGQSVRFGSTTKNSRIKNPWSNFGKNGDPIIIIKNGQKVDTNKEGWIPDLENINTDLSSIYFTSNQNIPIEISSKNQKSFNLITSKIQNNIYTPNNISGDNFNLNIEENNIENKNTPIKNIERNNISNIDDDFIVSDDKFEEGEGEELNETEYNGSVPSEGISVKNNPNKVVYKESEKKTNVIKMNFGKIYDGISIYSKPLLDMIAYSEGTIFKGNNNGYDIIVGFNEIVGWSENYSGRHPNILVKLNNKLSSTAAGRYQFLKKTWDSVAGKDMYFNKVNQDIVCNRYLIKGCKVSETLMKLAVQFSNKNLYDNIYFLQILDKISYKWASIAASSGKFRYSGQGEVKPEKAYEIFKQAIDLYGIE